MMHMWLLKEMHSKIKVFYEFLLLLLPKLEYVNTWQKQKTSEIRR